MIAPCKNCGHKAHTQDQLHGSGRRVFNEHTKTGNIVRKCTVCGYELSSSTTASGGDAAAKKPSKKKEKKA